VKSNYGETANGSASARIPDNGKFE
jgi:hypothetical protein